MSHTSIEYAHIYANNRISEEPISRLTDFMARRPTGSTSTLVVLIDDYSFPDTTFDYKKFITWLDQQHFKPDLVLRESDLIDQCSEVVEVIHNSGLKKQLENHIKAGKYPSELFIATWYLLRLGYVKASYFPERFVGDDLFNILPESFMPIENKALDIISSTTFSDAVEKVGYDFITGRPLT